LKPLNVGRILLLTAAGLAAAWLARDVLLLAFQATAGAVFGLMGTVVAVPLLVCIQELVKYLWVERITSSTSPASGA
jgi:predicted PurR-regulated permease PerM